MKDYKEEDIPLTPTPCSTPMLSCVYRDKEGICDEPQINYGNGDAMCYESEPYIVLMLLGVLE